MREHLFKTTSACCLLLSACTTLPNLVEATGGIPVYEIVLRAKCELSSAFEGDDGRWLVDEPKFTWLQNWTAQVDLTLQILDQATLAPGASLIQPLHNAYSIASGPSSITTSGVLGTTVSAIPQNLAVAAGISINGQAQRTQTMSFAVSIKELREWRTIANTRQLCAVSDSMDLRGRLGLREWVRETLWPVVSPDELLYAGYHPKQAAQAGPPKTPAPKAPGGGGAGVAGGGPTPQELVCSEAYINSRLDDLRQLQNSENGSQTAATEAESKRKSASSSYQSMNASVKKLKDTLKNNRRTFGAVLDPAVSSTLNADDKQLSDLDKMLSAIGKNLSDAGSALKDFDTTKRALDGEIQSAKESLNKALSSRSPESTPTNPNYQCNKADIEQRLQSAHAAADKSIVFVSNVKIYVDAATDNNEQANKSISSVSASVSKPIDPPIQSIGQSVQFILTYGGNVTPTWTFVRFRGPNNPLFSSDGTRMHLLNITLGPVNPDTNAPSEDVKQNQFYLQINSLNQPFTRR